jgi:hypothetical protein
MTAVEWLLEKYKSQNTLLFADDFTQANELFEQQIKDAFDECGNWQDKYSDSEHYYNKTYKPST